MGSKLNWFTAGVVAGLTAAAIGQELAKPRSERTWKGHVAGVPYSFRLDEWPDVANEYWNSDSDEIITEHVIGLGWGVNFAALAKYGRELLSGASMRRENGSASPAQSAESVSPPGKPTAPVAE